MRYLTSNSFTQEACQKFMTEHQDQVLANTNNNIFPFCVIDCSVSNGNLIIYECQSVLNSAISLEAFSELLSSFPNKIFIHNFDLHSCCIAGEDQKKIHLKTTLKKIPTWKVISEFQLYSGEFNLENESDEVKLIVFDVDSNGFFKKTLKNNFDQIHFYKHYQNRTDLCWASGDGLFETVLYSKYVQRLVLSNTGLCPPFIFLEKKSSYNEKDIQIICNSLQLNKNDSVVLKIDYGSRGEGETFIELNNLLAYLNSEKCAKKYAKEDVILIEKFVNAKINDNYYTQRYAVSAHNTTTKTLQIYYKKHSANDSHDYHNWVWYKIHEITDEKIKKQLTDAMQVIQRIDYFHLINQLLLSQNSILISIGLEVLIQNYKVLYIFYKTKIDDNAKSMVVEEVSLNFPSEVLDKLIELATGDLNLKRQKTYLLIEEIIKFLSLHNNNTTDLKTMEKLRKVIAIQSPDSFWSDNSQKNIKNLSELEEKNFAQLNEKTTSFSPP